MIPQPITKSIITTVQWGIPITDEVNRLTTQGDTDHSELAALQTLVDSIIRPNWMNIPLAAGFSATVAKYAVIGGNLVMLAGAITNVTGATLTANTTMATLPLEARPITSSFVVMTSSSATVNFTEGRSVRMNIQSSGNLQIQPSANVVIPNNTNISLSGCFFYIVT